MFSDFTNHSLHSCLYSTNKLLINDSILNFLNIQQEDELYTQVKYLIRQGYDDIESFFPYLGDLFLHKFLNVKYQESNPFMFQKKYKNKFLKTFESAEVRNIASWYFDNCNLNQFVSISSNDHIDDIVIKQEKDLIIDFNFDSEYLGRASSHEVSNYKFIIIDGQIETEGEVHHLIYSAEKEKVPYVIFCYGVSQEVKQKIIQLNSAGRTEIFPIDIEFSEDTVNLLPDIALVHNSDIVSCLKGQTISQEIRRSLKTGVSMKIFHNKLLITPVCNEDYLAAHREYLKQKKNSVAADVDTSYIDKRIKYLNTNSVSIVHTNKLLSNITFMRELDYFMKLISKINQPMCKVSFDKKQKYIPVPYLNYLNENINIFQEKYNNISTAIMLE